MRPAVPRIINDQKHAIVKAFIVADKICQMREYPTLWSFDTIEPFLSNFKFICQLEDLSKLINLTYVSFVSGNYCSGYSLRRLSVNRRKCHPMTT